MEFKFNKDLYTKEAVLKASYNYTDRAYIHIDIINNYYVIEIQPKNNNEINLDDFKNELLLQSVRQIVYKETRLIRESLATRALTSSIIEAEDDKENLHIESTNDFKEEEILQEWFNINE